MPLDEDMLRAGIHVALAIRLFQDGTLSLGKAAKLAGLTYEATMVEQLASIGVPAVEYPPEELDAKVAAVG